MCCSKYAHFKITKSLARIQYQKLWSTLFYSCHFLFLIFHFLCKCVLSLFHAWDLNMTIFCEKGSIHFRVISTGTRVNITLCIELYLIHLALLILLLILHFIFIIKQWFWYLLYMPLYCISLTRVLFLKQSGFGFKTIGELDICFSLPTLSLSISYFLFLLKRSLILHLTWHFSLQP